MTRRHKVLVLYVVLAILTLALIALAVDQNNEIPVAIAAFPFGFLIAYGTALWRWSAPPWPPTEAGYYPSVDAYLDRGDTAKGDRPKAAVANEPTSGATPVYFVDLNDHLGD